MATKQNKSNPKAIKSVIGLLTVVYNGLPVHADN